MNSPLWAGDEIGLSRNSDGGYDLGLTQLTAIEYHACHKHGSHLLLGFNNGDSILGTLQDDGSYTGEEADMPRSKQETEQTKRMIRDQINRELESQLAL
jgi:hypothetical protein